MNFRNAMSVMPLLIILSLGWTYQEYLPYILMGLFAILGLVPLTRIVRFTLRLIRNATLKDIDRMDGLVFEEYVAQLLWRNGYHNVRLTEQYDYGVDIIADKDGVRWGIQVKRYSGLVKASAVRQVFTALNIYGCDRAMVVTNSTFSNVAKALATSTGCVLVDRAALQRMMC